MPPELTEPVVIAYWTAFTATAAIFGSLTFANYVSYRQRPNAESRLYGLFTAAAMLESVNYLLVLVPMSADVKATFGRLVFLTATLSVALWVRSVAQFVGSTDRAFVWIPRALVTLGLIAQVVQQPVAGPALEDAWFIERAAGVTNLQTPSFVFLVGVTAALLLTSPILLMRAIRRERPSEIALQLGVSLTFVLGTAQTLTAFVSFVPLTFLANLIEATRISWATRQSIQRELDVVHRNQREQTAMIEAMIARQRVRERMASVGENTARLSHDIRSPMTAILIGIDSLDSEIRKAEPDLKEMKESIETAKTGTEHALRLVNLITDQARDESTVPPTVVDVDSVIKDAVALTKARAERSAVAVESPPATGIQTLGKPVELVQVLVNLIANACDALSGAEAATIRIELESTSDQAVLTVIDSGDTPPTDVLARMFVPHFTTKAARGGTGLGLAICQRIVSQHGGRIYVDAKRPHTTFVLELPLVDRNSPLYRTYDAERQNAPAGS